MKQELPSSTTPVMRTLPSPLSSCQPVQELELEMLLVPENAEHHVLVDEIDAIFQVIYELLIYYDIIFVLTYELFIYYNNANLFFPVFSFINYIQHALCY